MNAVITELARQIEIELRRVHWLATDAQPTLMVVQPTDRAGWVRVSDDWCSAIAEGPADVILSQAKRITADDDYGTWPA